MNTIQEEWENFLKKVIPENAPKIQKIETERAFYAGASSVIWIIDRLNENQSESVILNIWEGLKEECIDFFKNIFDESIM